MSTTVVVNGGPRGVVPEVPEALVPIVRSADRVVAVDSGCDVAHRLGLVVDVLVGDLDSVSPGALRRASAQGAVVVQHPSDKDRTDFELALSLACDRVAADDGRAATRHRLVVLGTASGRVDHLLATVGTLAGAPTDRWQVDVVLDDHHVVVVGPGRTDLPGSVGDTVSLVALGPGAQVRSTGGLLWPLRDERLEALAGRGVSNRVDSAPAWIDVAEGRLLAILSVVEPVPVAERIPVTGILVTQHEGGTT